MCGIPDAPSPLSTRKDFPARPSLFSRSTISAAILSSQVPLPMICGGSRAKSDRLLCHEWFIKNDGDFLEIDDHSTGICKSPATNILMAIEDFVDWCRR